MPARGFQLMVLANVLNSLDLITTLYAVRFLGFEEANATVREMLEHDPALYVTFKLGSILLLSALYVLASKRRSPLALGVSIGCVVGFCMAVLALGLATALNVIQIAGIDVRPILGLVARVIPTLR